MDSKKILQIHWHGRFGNRMFLYAFCNSLAERNGLTYYMPSEWEGTYLFNQTERVEIIPDAELRLHVNQSQKDMDTKEYRSKAVQIYKQKTNDYSLQHVTLKEDKIYNMNNFYYDDLDCMYAEHCHKHMSSSFVKNLFEFNDTVKNSEMYKEIETLKGTYDIVHLRRGDIAMPTYTGAHSMIAKQCYINALEHYGYEEKEVVWISDNYNETTIPSKNADLNIWYQKWLPKTHEGRHRWFYPTGEHKINDIVFFDFFIDFLLLKFARTIFRGNSAFSWWGAFLSDATNMYSPILQSKPLDKKEKYYVQQDVIFIDNNEPHFMGSIGEGFVNIKFND